VPERPERGEANQFVGKVNEQNFVLRSEIAEKDRVARAVVACEVQPGHLSPCAIAKHRHWHEPSRIGVVVHRDFPTPSTGSTPVSGRGPLGVYYHSAMRRPL